MRFHGGKEMHNKVYKLGAILVMAFTLLSVIHIVNGQSVDIVDEVHGIFAITETDMDNYAGLYYDQYGRSLKKAGLVQNNVLETETKRIAPLKLLVITEVDGIDVMYGCYVLAVIEDKRVTKFVIESVCGDYVSVNSSIWKFNKYFVNSMLLDDTSISLAIRGNLQIRYGDNILVSKETFTDTYRCNLPYALE